MPQSKPMYWLSSLININLILFLMMCKMVDSLNMKKLLLTKPMFSHKLEW